MLYFKEHELAVVIDHDSKLMNVDEEDIKNENKKRDEADEADEKGFALSEEMKEDLILLVAIILILCLTSSIVVGLTALRLAFFMGYGSKKVVEWFLYSI